MSDKPITVTITRRLEGEETTSTLHFDVFIGGGIENQADGVEVTGLSMGNIGGEQNALCEIKGGERSEHK